MMARLRIAVIQLWHAPGRSAILVLCIAVSVAIPTLTTLLVRHYDDAGLRYAIAEYLRGIL